MSKRKPKAPKPQIAGELPPCPYHGVELPCKYCAAVARDIAKGRTNGR